MTTADDTGEILFKRAILKDKNTIELTLNNSGGGSLENTLQAAVMDSYLRGFYKHSELYDQAEPTIKTVDLSGTVVAENDKEIEADASSNEPKDLGIFKLGEMVNIEGNIITLTNARYTKERNEFADKKPEEVIIFDVEYQNSTQEEQLIDGSDFEVYDKTGEKMDTYPIDYITETVQAGKHVKGRAAFGVSGKAPYEVYYNDMLTDTKAKWIMDVK
jgi:hypothetical protein